MRLTPKAFVGIASCAAAAGLLSLFVQDDPSLRPVVPLVLLLVVIPTAHLGGIRSAIVGATIASLTFAVLLFPPLGSLAVHDDKDRIIVISFQVGAMVVSYMLSHVRPA